MQRFCQGSGLVGLAPTGRDGGEGPFCWRPPPFAEPRNKTQPTHTRNRDYEYGANKSSPNTVPAHPDTSSSSTSTSLHLNCITQSGIDIRIPAVNAIVISALSATTCGGTEIQSPPPATKLRYWCCSYSHQRLHVLVLRVSFFFFSSFFPL